jgi:hypothetical protein
MQFVQRNDVIEKLSPTASHPTLGGSILPGRLDTRALRLKAGRLQQRDHIPIELRIVVEDHITILTRLGKCFPQLLYHPFRTRSAGDIEMQDSAPAVFNYKEAIQQFESDCRNGKEIDGRNCFAMISEKAKPALAWISAASELSEISGNRALRDLETELQKFTMDPRCTPACVV